jgi:hypothetical protein
MNRPSASPELLTGHRTPPRDTGSGHRPANLGEDVFLVFAFPFIKYFLSELGYGSSWRAVLFARVG